MADGRYF